MTEQRLAILAEAGLASRYNLPLISADQTSDYDLWLERRDGQLKLVQALVEGWSDLSIDFCRGKYAYRLKQTRELKLPLGKACGLSKGRRPEIVDATAGLAQDGLLLAALGSEVTLIEQHPMLHALIADALQRAAHGPDWIKPIIERVTLVYADATDWLADKQVPVIYLDPMYPDAPKSKTAQIKKAMQLLRKLQGTTTDTGSLWQVASRAATERLVVKRPDWADYLSGREPDQQIHTRTHHYDIYLAGQRVI